MFPAAMLNAHMDLKLEQCDLYLLYLSMNDAYLWIAGYHAPRFWKKLYNVSWGISLHDLGPQPGQNCPFGQKANFWGNFS